VQALEEKDLAVTISDIFQDSLTSQARYVPLLNCLREIAKHSSKAADGFIQKFSHRNLLEEIKVTYYNYKKHNDLKSASG